jgi:hypothetical protein
MIIGGFTVGLDAAVAAKPGETAGVLPAAQRYFLF